MPPESATPTGMVDLHCHVLPGIDDGATDLAEAVALCRQAAAAGSTVMVATPHLRHARFWNGDRAALETLRDAVAAEVEGEVEILLGGEIALHSESLEEIYELPQGELLTLAGSRYVLLEVDWHGLGPDLFEVVHELRIRDLVPVIAHPERVAWLGSDPSLLAALVERGALMQLTAMSITGEIGRIARGVSEELLDAGLVHFVASDAHDPRQRPPGLGPAYREVERRCGAEVAERLFIAHPRAVVQNQPLPKTTQATCEAS